jgi:hypothetical protein
MDSRHGEPHCHLRPLSARITSIDAGNTLVIEFEDAGGETVKILVPSEEVATFNEKLAAAMSEAGE